MDYPKGHKFKKNLFGVADIIHNRTSNGFFQCCNRDAFVRKTELPFGSFVLLMQPIHLAIGVVEGLVTAAVVIFVWRTRPELFEGADEGKVQDGISVKKLLAVFSVAAIIVGVFFPGLHHRLLTVLNGLLKRQQEQLNWKSRAKFMKHCRRYSRKPLFTGL